jgi:hypothetical protein
LGCLRVLFMLLWYAVCQRVCLATADPVHEGVRVWLRRCFSIPLLGISLELLLCASVPSVLLYQLVSGGCMRAVWLLSIFLCLFVFRVCGVFSTWTSVASRLAWGPFTTIWAQLVVCVVPAIFISLRLWGQCWFTWPVSPAPIARARLSVIGH